MNIVTKLVYCLWNDAIIYSLARVRWAFIHLSSDTNVHLKAQSSVFEFHTLSQSYITTALRKFLAKDSLFVNMGANMRADKHW